jgi:hypothetical protein
MNEDGRPRCRRCGKVLKTPESIAAGIGPVCLLREIAAAAKIVEKPKRRKTKVRGRGELVIDPAQLLLFPVEVQQ